MKELVEAIAKALVDYSDRVQVRAIEGEEVTIFELRVEPSDLGRIIGRQGRTIEAMRGDPECGGCEAAKALRARNP